LNGGYRYSFADPIRQMLMSLGIDMYDPYWIERKEDVIPALGVSPRRLMQTLGTDWGRQMIHQNIWLTLAAQRFLRTGPGMVIADVRFDNEANWVRNNGGLVVHLKRDEVHKVESHVSEAGVTVKEADITIVNNGTLVALQAAIRTMFDETGKPVHTKHPPKAT
jgi:hypothetical protein